MQGEKTDMKKIYQVLENMNSMLQKHGLNTPEKRRELVASIKAVKTKDFRIRMQMALHAKVRN